MQRSQAGITKRVNTTGPAGAQANGYSGPQTISADGFFVAYTSNATNLVPGDTNLASDFFVRDRHTGITTRINVSSDGAQADRGSSDFGAPSISGNGRFVTFASLASNLVPGDTNGTFDVFVRDRQAGITKRVNTTGPAGAQANGQSFPPAISARLWPFFEFLSKFNGF